MNKIQQALGVFVIAVAIFLSSPKKGKATSEEMGTTVFFDDFSGPSLDRTKWNIWITGEVYNREQQAYVDSVLTIYTVRGADAEGASNGALVIHPRYSPGFVTRDGKKFDFLSGRIHSMGKVDFTYGSVTARIKMTEGTGLWPAWWMLGNGTWPETGEIDIMEFVGQSEWVNAAVHGPGYSGNTPFYKRDSLSATNPVTNWHVYGVNWTNSSLEFTVDGKTFYTLTRAMVEKYGKWSFDTPKHMLLNFALGGNYPAGVNRIESPYHGIPQETVEAIKAGKCKMLVDWVKVEQK